MHVPIMHTHPPNARLEWYLPASQNTDNPKCRNNSHQLVDIHIALYTHHGVHNQWRMRHYLCGGPGNEI